MSPLVSIIIPTYLRPYLIIETLKSIIEQSYLNWECIIIDDGSDAPTLNIISQFIISESRINLYNRPCNSKKGPSTCRNEGLKKAKGKYIQFFDDDDIMYPTLLKHKVNIMESKKCDVLVSPLDFFSMEKNLIIHSNNVFSINILESYVLGEISWYVSGPLWLKSFVTEYFDETVQTLDDWDFNLRNIFNNPHIEFLNISMQRYNIYGVGQTLGTLAQLGDELQIASVFYVYKKHFLLLKKMKILNSKMYVRFYILLVPILRESLMREYKISTEIFRFLVVNVTKDMSLKFFKVFLGYYTYKYFNKGYNLVKI